MSSPKSMYFYTQGLMTDFRSKLVSVRATAPKPVLS